MNTKNQIRVALGIAIGAFFIFVMLPFLPYLIPVKPIQKLKPHTHETKHPIDGNNSDTLGMSKRTK